MYNKIQLLDCTLRDGGLGFEDAAKNNDTYNYFTTEMMKAIAGCLCASKIDIIELGSIEISSDDKRKFAIYQDIESVSAMIPVNQVENQMYVALFRGPDTPIEDIPDWNESLCEGIRVIIRYSELQKSIDFCSALAQKGYKVFVQPMLTMRYTEEELRLLIDASNIMGAYALYFVDSYGYMQTKDVLRFFNKFDKGLNKNIRIGFHAHNNLNLAFSNVQALISQETDREIIIDSCIMGLGQGAGNLPTELITGYINNWHNACYNYDEILDVCEIIENFWQNNTWGYSVTRLIPALYNSAYKYSEAFRNQFGLSYKEINRLFKNMPYDFRQRYTPQNAKEMLKMFGSENVREKKQS